MGFFNKLKNLITKGQFKEDKTIQEEKKQKQRQEEINKKQKTKTTKEEIEEIEQTNKKKRKEEETNPDEEEIEQQINKETATEEQQKETRQEQTKILEEYPELIKEEDKKEFEEAAKTIKETEQTTLDDEEIKREVSKATKRIQRYTQTERDIHNKIDELDSEHITTYGIDFTGNEDEITRNNIIISSIINSGTKIDKQIAEIIVQNLPTFKTRFTTDIILEMENGDTNQILAVGILPNEARAALEEEGINEGMNIDGEGVGYENGWWKQKYPSLTETLKKHGAIDTTTGRVSLANSTIKNIKYKLRFR